MIRHGCHADGGMLRQAGRDLAGGAAEKALHVDRDRPALHPPDTEREFLEPLGDSVKRGVTPAEELMSRYDRRPPRGIEDAAPTTLFVAAERAGGK